MCSSSAYISDPDNWDENCHRTCRTATAAMPKSSTYEIREHDILEAKQGNCTQKICDLGGPADQDVSKPESRCRSLVPPAQTAALCDPMTVTIVSSRHPARPVYTRSCKQLHRLLGVDLGSAKRLRDLSLLSSPRVHDIQMKLEGPHLGDLPQDLASRLHSFLRTTLGMPPLHVSVGQGCVHLVALLLDISAGRGIAGLAAHRRRRRFHGGCGASDVASLPARLMAFMRGVLPDSAAPVRVTVRQGGRVYEMQAGDTAAAEPPQQLKPQLYAVRTVAGEAAILTAATDTRPEQHAAWSSERLQLPSASSVETSILAPGGMDRTPEILPLMPKAATAPTPTVRQVVMPALRGDSTWGSSTPNHDSFQNQAVDGTPGQRALAALELMDPINEAFMHHQTSTAATSPVTSLHVAFSSAGCVSVAGGSVGPPGATHRSCSADTGSGLSATAVLQHNVSGAHLGRLPPSDAGTVRGCSTSVSVPQVAMGHLWLPQATPPQAFYSAGSNVRQSTSNYESTELEVDLSYHKRVLEHTASKGRAQTNRIGSPPSPLDVWGQPRQPETQQTAAGTSATAVVRGSDVDVKSSRLVANSMALRQQSLVPLLQPELPARQVLALEQISTEGQTQLGRVRSAYRKWTQPGEGGGAAAAATANISGKFPSASSGQYGTSPEDNAADTDGICPSLTALHNRSLAGDWPSNSATAATSYSFSAQTASAATPKGSVAPMAANRHPTGTVPLSSRGAAGDLASGNASRGAPSAVPSEHRAPSDASGVWPPLYPPAVRACVVSTALGASGSGAALVTANSTTSSRSLLGAAMEQLEAMSRRLMLPMPVSLARLHAHPVTQPVELLCPAVLTWPAATRDKANVEPSSWPTDWYMPVLPAQLQFGSSVRLLMRCPDVIARPSFNSGSMSTNLADTFHRDTGSVSCCQAPQAVTPSSRGVSVGDGLSAANLHMANRTASNGAAGQDSDVDSELACSGHVSQLMAWNRSGAVTVMQVDDSAEGCTSATLLLVPDASSRERRGRAPDMSSGKAPMRPPEQGNQRVGSRDIVAAASGGASSSPSASLSVAPACLAHLVYVAWRRGQSLGPSCPVLLLSEGLEDVVEELQELQPPPMAAAEGTARNSRIGSRTTSPTVQLPQQHPDHDSHRPQQQSQSAQQMTQQAALIAYHSFLSDLGVWLEGLQLATSSTGSPTTGTSCLHRSNLSVHGTPSGARTGSTSGVRTPHTPGYHGESSALVALLTAGGATSNGSAPSISGAAQVGGTGDDRHAAASAACGVGGVVTIPASAAVRTYVDRFAATPVPADPTLPPVSPRIEAIHGDVSPFRTMLITPSASSPAVPGAPPAASTSVTQQTSANEFESDERVARLADEILGVGCDLLRHAIASGAVATAQLILKVLLTYGPRFTRLRAMATVIEGNPISLFGGSTADPDADISPAALAATRSAILRLILETCRAANAVGQTLLHLAVMSGSLRMLQVMLEVWPQELGLDVQILNRRDRFGRAPVDVIGGGAMMAAGTGRALDEDGVRDTAAAARFASGASLLLNALGVPLEEDPTSNAAFVTALSTEPSHRWGLHVVKEGSSEGRAVAALVSMHVQRIACPGSGASDEACGSGSLVGSNGEDQSWGQQGISRARGNGDHGARGIEFDDGGSVGDDANGQSHSFSDISSHAARLTCLRRRRDMAVAAGGTRYVRSDGGWRGAGGLLWLQPEQSAVVEGTMALRPQGQSSSVARAGSQGNMPVLLRLWGALVILLGAVQALLVLLFAMPRARALPPSASLMSQPGLLLWLPCVSLIASSGLSAAAGLLLRPRQLAKMHWLPSLITALGRSLASTMALAAAEQLPMGHELTAMAVWRKASVAASNGDGPMIDLVTMMMAAGGRGSGRSDLFGMEAGVRMLVLTLAPAALEADPPSARAALLGMEHILPLIYVATYGNIDVYLMWMLYAMVNVTCGVVVATVAVLKFR